ncbi:Fc.00g081530.m01.CDS01 [Cosmosporella sp. VM-42]
MRCSSRLFSIATLLAPVPAILVTYDAIYDEPSRPLSDVACWNNQTGLLPGYDWQTQGNIPLNILAVDTITNPNSTACVSCWILEYEGRARHFLAIDHADSGLITSLRGMKSLTNGKSVEFDRIDVIAAQVDMIDCGYEGLPFLREQLPIE